jgi:hypothetical protein
MMNGRRKNIGPIIWHRIPIFSGIGSGITVELGQFYRGIQTICFSYWEKIERRDRRESNGGSNICCPAQSSVYPTLVDTIAAVAVLDTSRLSLP